MITGSLRAARRMIQEDNSKKRGAPTIAGKQACPSPPPALPIRPSVYSGRLGGYFVGVALNGYFVGVALNGVRMRCPASTGMVTPVTLAARSELR
jgi:hypothetical protein